MATPDPREAFQRLADQFQRRAKAAASGGGGGGLPGKAVFGGSGLLVLLIAGGLAVNASIYNGALVVDINVECVSDGYAVDQWMVVTGLLSIRGPLFRSALFYAYPVVETWALDRLHGITKDVYPEGTHFMVRISE